MGFLFSSWGLLSFRFLLTAPNQRSRPPEKKVDAAGFLFYRQLHFSPFFLPFIWHLSHVSFFFFYITQHQCENSIEHFEDFPENYVFPFEKIFGDLLGSHRVTWVKFWTSWWTAGEFFFHNSDKCCLHEFWRQDGKERLLLKRNERRISSAWNFQVGGKRCTIWTWKHGLRHPRMTDKFYKCWKSKNVSTIYKMKKHGSKVHRVVLKCLGAKLLFGYSCLTAGPLECLLFSHFYRIIVAKSIEEYCCSLTNSNQRYDIM